MLLRMFWFKPQNPKLVLMLLRMFTPPVWKQNQLCVLYLASAAEVQPQGFNCFWVTSFTSDALSCVICCSCRILGSEWALAGSVLPPHRVVSSDSAGSARDLLLILDPQLKPRLVLLVQGADVLQNTVSLCMRICVRLLWQSWLLLEIRSEFFSTFCGDCILIK